MAARAFTLKGVEVHVAPALHPERFPIPMPLIDRLLMASPRAHALLTTAILRGAIPKAIGSVYLAGDRYIALVDFEEPLADGTDGLALPLGIVAE